MRDLPGFEDVGETEHSRLFHEISDIASVQLRRAGSPARDQIVANLARQTLHKFVVRMQCRKGIAVCRWFQDAELRSMARSSVVEMVVEAVPDMLRELDGREDPKM